MKSIPRVSKMSGFQQKITRDAKKQCDLSAGKKVGNRNCPWEGSDIRFNRQRFQISHYKYVQRTKGNHA